MYFSQCYLCFGGKLCPLFWFYLDPYLEYFLRVLHLYPLIFCEDFLCIWISTPLITLMSYSISTIKGTFIKYVIK